MCFMIVATQDGFTDTFIRRQQLRSSMPPHPLNVRSSAERSRAIMGRNGTNVRPPILTMRISFGTAYMKLSMITNCHTDKARIVEEGNWWKFTSSKEQLQMKKKLLSTGDRELVEVRRTTD